jgi:hypothetical protein
MKSPAKAGSKSAAFWDEDDEPAPAPAPTPKTPVSRQQSGEITLREALSVHTVGGDHKQPLLILDKLDPNWQELLCYSRELQTNLHVRRRDLVPVDVVDRVISTLAT